MKLHEFEPVGEKTPPHAVRRDEASVLTCARCGCRLTARESLEDGGMYGPNAAWRHFPGIEWGRDARGCRVECMDEPHKIRFEAQPA